MLWEERFKSVLVEGSGDPLSTMAAPIDINPARAGLVEDPKQYRLCGYGAAATGNATAPGFSKLGGSAPAVDNVI